MDDDCGAQAARPISPLDDVPEEDEYEDALESPPESRHREEQTSRQRRAASRELYLHEVLALVACLVLPLISACLLHAIRSQLSRPSEGLVSHYNLTIFLLASELRVFSHMLRLVQSRTLHLQRVVHGCPFATPLPGAAPQVDDMLGRIARLEARLSPAQGDGGAGPESPRAEHEAVVARHVRDAIQPELDALNRAVRRYEKKAALLQLQTDARFSDVDERLDDAMALAPAASNNGGGGGGRAVMRAAASAAAALALLPFRATHWLLLLPLRPLLALAARKAPVELPPPARQGRGSRVAGKAPLPPRFSGDRAPGRVVKR